MAFDWADDLPVLQGHAREVYSFQGRAPHMGEVFRNPGQAEVLRRIAREGRKGFYEGEVAEDIVASLRALGGTHTLDDLAATACDYTQPIAGAYGDLELLEHPPNGQGATAILLLNILKHFDLKAMDPFGSQRAHIEAEATKLAYDARNRFIADPDHMSRLDHMLSAETAAKLATLIDPKRAMASAAPLTEAVHRDTIYITGKSAELSVKEVIALDVRRVFSSASGAGRSMVPTAPPVGRCCILSVSRTKIFKNPSSGSPPPGAW